MMDMQNFISNALTQGLLDLNDKLETESFKNLNDSFEFFQRGVESAEYESGDFRTLERLALEEVTKNLYTVLMMNPLTFSVVLSRMEVGKLETIKDYCDTAIRATQEMSKFQKQISADVKDEHKASCYIFYSKKENRDVFAKMVRMMEKLRPFFESSIKAQRVCEDKGMSDREFLRIISGFNIKMIDAVDDVLSNIQNLDDLAPGLQTYLSGLKLHFAESARDVAGYGVKLELEILINEDEAPVRKSEPAPISEAEKERLHAIEVANEKYDEFVHYTMRDLEKQVPYSVRSMYETLIDKFENFVKRFSMPLSSNTSMGAAKEASAQLDRLFEYVSKISENATVSIVYGNQKQ